MENKPLSYVDKKNKISPKYCFISYSHKDLDSVYGILNELFSNGVNYWYDKELKPSDVWDEKVREHIENPNCVGTIFFISESSLDSEAVSKEIEIVKNIKESNEKHFVMLILIGFNKIKDINTYINERDKFELLGNFLQISKKGKSTFVEILNFQNKKNDILQVLIENKVVENQKITITEEKVQYLNEVTIEQKDMYLKIGVYPFLKDEQKDKIVWKLIYKEDNFLYFVSNYAIDFISYSEVNSKIKEIFDLVNHKEYIESCFLINSEIIEKYNKLIGKTFPTDYADKKRNQHIRLFWVKENNNLILCNSENKKIDILKLILFLH